MAYRKIYLNDKSASIKKKGDVICTEIFVMYTGFQQTYSQKF